MIKIPLYKKNSTTLLFTPTPTLLVVIVIVAGFSRDGAQLLTVAAEGLGSPAKQLATAVAQALHSCIDLTLEYFPYLFNGLAGWLGLVVNGLVVG